MMATEYNKDLICFASFIDIYGIRRKMRFSQTFLPKSLQVRNYFSIFARRKPNI